jgi:hypothetical protein
MPHQTPQAPNGTDQNAATDRAGPNDQARDQHRTVRPDPDAYAARDVRDSTLAPPASGEMGDYADEDQPSGGAQQGGDRTRVSEKDDVLPQGPKTREANRRMAGSGSPDQGTH